MGFWRTTRSITGHIINVRVDKWFGLDFFRQSLSGLSNTAKDLFIPKQAERAETFEEAMQRLNLTEADLTQRKREFTRLFIFYIAVATLIFGYSIYLALQGHIMGFLMTFCLTLYSLSHAFRYHFWLFQIKHRKLGCTLKDWFNAEGNP